MKRRRWDAILDRVPNGEKVVGVEVGVWDGKLSNRLLAARPELTLYMVDAWKAAEEGSSFAESGAQMAEYPQERFDLSKERAKEVAMRYGRRARIVEADSVDAAEDIAGRRVAPSFLFIDGDHSYEGVKRDLEAWAPLIGAGALFIAGHDYENNHGEVKRAVDEYFGAEVVETDEDHTWFVKAENVTKREAVAEKPKRAKRKTRESSEEVAVHERPEPSNEPPESREE